MPPKSSFCKAKITILTLVALICCLSGTDLGNNDRTALGSPFVQSQATETAASGAAVLTPGVATNGNLAAGQTQIYSITLQTNEFFHVTIAQKGTDLSVTVLSPGGDKIRELDCRRRTITPISFIASQSGEYQLKLVSSPRLTGWTQYELQVAPLRQSFSKDEDAVRGQKTIEEAERLFAEGKLESSHAGINNYESAIQVARSNRNRSEEAYALRRIGDVYQSLSKFQNALDVYAEALAAYRSVGYRREEAGVRNAMSGVYLGLGQNDKALQQSVRAKELSRSLGNGEEGAESLNNIGEINNWSGKLHVALTFYDQALSIWKKLNDKRGEAQTYLYLGYTYSDLGQPREAFKYFNQALAIWQATVDRRSQAITLTALGRLYSRVGESQQALNFFQRALPMARAVGDQIEEGRVLNGMGYTYDQLGEISKAIEYYEKVVSIYRGAPYRRGEGATLYDVGRIYNSLGRHDEALNCFENALEISRITGDRRLSAFAVREIGRAYDSMGQKEKALKNYVAALSFWQEGKDFRPQAETLNWMGQIYADQGQSRPARAHFERALTLSRKAEYRFAEAASLYNIARLERDLGNLPAARIRAEEALLVVESLRERVNSQNVRTTYFASIRSQYEFYIDLLMRQHKQDPSAAFIDSAFDASERARARSLLETLVGARVSVRENTDSALVEREGELTKLLNDLIQRQVNLRSSTNDVDPQMIALGKEIEEVSWQLHEVEAQIGSRSVDQVIARSGQPFKLPEIQKRILDDNTLLLEYMLGDERSYLWVVTRTTISSYELPPRAEIEGAVKAFRQLLTAHQVAGLPLDQRQAAIAKADLRIPSVAASLGNLVLGPIAEQLGNKRLIIVADGGLQSIPFQALSVSSNETDREANGAEAPVPLIVNHEIVYQPSASALAAMLASDTKRRLPRNSVAVFASPVFEANDPRVQSAGRANSALIASTDTTQALEAFRDAGVGDGLHLPVLPASREEAEAIMSVVPWSSGFKALDFDANRATVAATDFSQFSIVHFATHGLVNYEHPQLSGLMLSLVDQQGRPREGFLHMHDIYNLNLPVDLVVLSACNTGLGKDVKGEGLIGLTRGFMYAGAKGVVASLWKVDDEATAELMKRFYEGMFRDGLTPAAALRQAQIAMWRQERWRAPYHWAAFIIQGRYDQTPNAALTSARAQWLVTSGGILSALLLAACLVVRRRRTRSL